MGIGHLDRKLKGLPAGGMKAGKRCIAPSHRIGSLTSRGLGRICDDRPFDDWPIMVYLFDITIIFI